MQIKTVKRIFTIALSIVITLSVLPGMTQKVSAASLNVSALVDYINIWGTWYLNGAGDPGATLLGDLHAELDQSDPSGKTVLVTGAVTGATGSLPLDIDSGVTVKWTASLSGEAGPRGYMYLISCSGSGVFEVADGALIVNSATYGRAIGASGTVTVKVSGGSVSSDHSDAIHTGYNSGSPVITVTGGTVYTNNSTAISADNTASTVNISGGMVSTDTGSAIYAIGKLNVSGGTVSALSAGGTAITGVGGSFECSINGGIISAVDVGKAITLTNGSVYYCGGTIDEGGISKTGGAGYYIGDNVARFSEDFIENTNLFKLDNFTLAINGNPYIYDGSVPSPNNVIAQFSNKLKTTSITAVNAVGTMVLASSNFTFDRTTKSPDVTLTVTATIAGTSIPVSFTTEPFGINIIETDAIPPRADNVSVNADEPLVGTKITASYDYVVGSGIGNGSEASVFKWYRGDTAVWNPANPPQEIIDETDITYTPTGADVGKYLYFEVTPTNGTLIGETERSAASGMTGIMVYLVEEANGTTGEAFIRFSPTNEFGSSVKIISESFIQLYAYLNNASSVKLTAPTGAFSNPTLDTQYFLYALPEMNKSITAPIAITATFTGAFTVTRTDGSKLGGYGSFADVVTAINNDSVTTTLHTITVNAQINVPTLDMPTKPTKIVGGNAAAQLIFGSGVIINANAALTFDNITVYIGTLYANGHLLTLGSGLKNYIGSNTNFATIYGGANNSSVAGTNIIIEGGWISTVYSGGNMIAATVSGDTNLTITGGTIGSNIYGGGRYSSVVGNTNVTITGGTMKNNVYGGGFAASSATVGGNINVTLLGGAVGDGTVYSKGQNIAKNGNIYITDALQAKAAAGSYANLVIVDDAGIATIAGKTITASGDGTTTGSPKTASIEVAKSMVSIALADIVAATGTNATVEMYSSGAFTTSILSQNLINGINHLYIKVLAYNNSINVDGYTDKTMLYYDVTVTHDPTEDNLDISAAKGLIEGMTFTDTQVNAGNISQAKAAVENIIGTLNLSGVSAVVNDGAFIGATAGAAENVIGTNGTYTFTVTLNKGAGTEQTTATLTLTITATTYALPSVNAQPPSIGTQPQGGTVTVGTTHDLIISATSPDSGALSYQWYSNTSSSNSGGTLIGSATSATYAAPINSRGTYYYYVVVTNTIADNGDGGIKTAITASNAVTLIVNALINTHPVYTHTITASAGTGGTISPSGSVSVNDGGSRAFTITAGSGYQISQVLVDGSNIPSAVSSGSYTFSNVTTNHTISASFTYNGGDGGDGDDGGGDGSSSGGGTPATPIPTPAKTVDIIINGQTLKATLNADGSLTLTCTEAEIKKYADNSGELDIIASGSYDSITFNVNIPALGGDDLAIETDSGTIIIPNATLQALRALCGDTLRLVISKGSFKVALLNANNKEVAYNNQAKPFILKLPYKLVSGKKQSRLLRLSARALYYRLASTQTARLYLR